MLRSLSDEIAIFSLQRHCNKSNTLLSVWAIVADVTSETHMHLFTKVYMALKIFCIIHDASIVWVTGRSTLAVVCHSQMPLQLSGLCPDLKRHCEFHPCTHPDLPSQSVSMALKQH